MKIFLIISILLWALVAGNVGATSLEYKSPTSRGYENITPITIDPEEPRMCTMEYAPVCGVDGITYGNACGAGKTPIAYSGECDPYVSLVRYKRLEKTQSAAFQKKLMTYDLETLSNNVESLNQKIEAVKKSKISRSAQIQKITLYVFTRNMILEVLSKSSGMVE